MNPFRELRHAWRAQDIPEIERAATAALALDRTLPELYYQQGFARLHLGKHAEAVTALEACLERKPSYPLLQRARMALALARSRLSPVDPRREPSMQAPVPVSVIICSITPRKFDRVQANYSRLLKDVPHEIVGIHDARSLSDGYNRGVARAIGEILIFSHDDIEIVSPDFSAKLLNRLGEFDLIGIAGTDHVCGGAWTDAGWPRVFGQCGSPAAGGRVLTTAFVIDRISATPMQALDGVFFAARRSVLEKIQFDETSFDGWHLYDLDFTFSAALAGFRLGVCNDLLVVHESAGGFGDAWLQYARKFVGKHLQTPPERYTSPQLDLCGMWMNTVDEWRSFTHYMTSGASANAAKGPGPQTFPTQA